MINVLNTYFTSVFKTVVKNALDRQTLYFTAAFFPHQQTIHFLKTTRTKLAASVPYWWLLTSPVVDKTCGFLCKFKQS